MQFSSVYVPRAAPPTDINAHGRLATRPLHLFSSPFLQANWISLEEGGPEVFLPADQVPSKAEKAKGKKKEEAGDGDGDDDDDDAAQADDEVRARPQPNPSCYRSPSSTSGDLGEAWQLDARVLHGRQTHEGDASKRCARPRTASHARHACNPERSTLAAAKEEGKAARR